MNYNIDNIKEAFISNPVLLLEHLGYIHNEKLSNSKQFRFGNKGSLSIRIEDGCIYDFEEEKPYDCISLIEQTLNYSFQESLKYIGNLYGVYEHKQFIPKKQKPKKSFWNKKNTMKIINNSIPIQNTKAELYLKNRKCYFESENLKYSKLYYTETKKDEHCLIAIIRDYFNYDNILGILRIFIDEKGQKLCKKLSLIEEKKELPTIYRAIFLDCKNKQKEINICEGVETGLSILALKEKNVISCINSGNLSNFFNNSLNKLTIWQDRDNAGINATSKIKRRYILSNTQTNIFINKPLLNNKYYNDFNDLLVNKKEIINCQN